MMASCEAYSMTDSLLVGVSFEWVNFRFWFEAIDVLFNFRNLFRSLYLFLIMLVGKFALSFTFKLRSLYIVELAKNDSGAATIADNKIHFSAVRLSVPIRLTGKFAFVFFPFCLNQY